MSNRTTATPSAPHRPWSPPSGDPRRDVEPGHRQPQPRPLERGRACRDGGVLRPRHRRLPSPGRGRRLDASLGRSQLGPRRGLRQREVPRGPPVLRRPRRPSRRCPTTSSTRRPSRSPRPRASSRRRSSPVASSVCTLQDLPTDLTYDVVWATHALYAVPVAELAAGRRALRGRPGPRRPRVRRPGHRGRSLRRLLRGLPRRRARGRRRRSVHQRRAGARRARRGRGRGEPRNASATPAAPRTAPSPRGSCSAAPSTTR